MPNMAKGVTIQVTQGMATKLVSNPTKDTWPKNKTDKGVRANMTIHCSLAKPTNPCQIDLPILRRKSFRPLSCTNSGLFDLILVRSEL